MVEYCVVSIYAGFGSRVVDSVADKMNEYAANNWKVKDVSYIREPSTPPSTEIYITFEREKKD